MTDLSSASLHRLDRFGTLIATGPDAKSYLQGQLSFDLERLTRERIELATCSSPQGRVQAVLWLIERDDAIVMLLPTSILDSTLARLKKYVLRAKAKIESGAGRFQVCGAAALLEGEPRAHREIGLRSYIRWPGNSPRVLCIAERELVAPADAAFENAWHKADIEAGLPQVYPQTHEAFVAQMLNVDLLGGIDFEKGCYTGQEIIARTHYRGAVKRRMFRFRTQSEAPAPGTRIVVGDQHAGDVVDAAATVDGSELLAVVSLASVDATLELDTQERGRLERLAVPYAV